MQKESEQSGPRQDKAYIKMLWNSSFTIVLISHRAHLSGH